MLNVNVIRDLLKYACSDLSQFSTIHELQLSTGQLSQDSSKQIVNLVFHLQMSQNRNNKFIIAILY